uniref:Uncharacterized protein n=1 Tax=Eutreptiella gymnastica TaxID=73025 RepID=A0A6U8C100_9EUGL|mmetsp:Transcript_22610/g.40588  ORF Transcript_22610/g.40588 Transcript_22610/m.40588 type:complete len:137 (+) Transcript_22610:330-740(+)
MYLQKPVSSKLCTAKIQERDYKMHKSNLSQAKSVLDVAPPPSMSFPHIKVKAKRIKNIQERQNLIDRDNNALLSNMENIWKRSPTDKTNKDYELYSARSLNASYRKREAAEIAKVNEKLLERLEEARSVYNFNTPR